MLQYFAAEFRLLIFCRKFIEIPTPEDSCKDMVSPLIHPLKCMLA